MNTAQYNYLNMSTLMRDFLLASHDITDKLTDFGEPFAGLCSTITQIEAVAALQVQNKTGITVSKSSVHKALILAMVGISIKCKRYARVNKNPEFRALTKMTKSGLNNLGDKALIIKCQSFIETVQAKLADLASVKVTAESIHDLSQLLESFNQIFQQPETSVQNKKELTAQLKVLFVTLKEFQKTLDDIAEGISDEEPAFYNSYLIKRVVPKLGVRQAAFMLTLLDYLTQKGKPNVEIRIRLKGGPQLKKYIKKSGKKGRILIRSLAPGEYVYEIVYLGYKTLTGSFFIHEGETTKLTFVMEKEG